jgi:hypothetical protein
MAATKASKRKVPQSKKNLTHKRYKSPKTLDHKKVNVERTTS